jgi:hypothetical protein
MGNSKRKTVRKILRNETKRGSSASDGTLTTDFRNGGVREWSEFMWLRAGCIADCGEHENAPSGPIQGTKFDWL